MAKKISEKTMPEDKNMADLIKSLGGAQRIYKYLLSKNKNITVESIYKWKKNGIPYRYRTAIEELSTSNNINLMDNAFLDKKDSDNKKTEIISSTGNKNKITFLNNIFLYLLLIFSIFLLIYIFYNNNNINRVEEKIIKIEKIVSSISPKDYSVEIKNFNNVNQIQNNKITKNASKIDEISISNNNLQSLINEIQRERSNSLSTQVQNIDASKINSIYSLLYLMNIKNDLQFSNPDLNEFNDIKSYLRSLTVPENVEIALNKLDQLSILELKSHNKIIDEIHNVELKINNITNKNVNEEKTLLDKFKKLVKITKTNNSTFVYTKSFQYNLINTLSNHNYEKSIYELNNINQNGKFNESIQDIKNLEMLYESINLIVKWLIFEG
ncbi:MAG: hypothetical protein CMJ11_07145 [Pelagibacterales bacterium]|nr:hypothetical protein [Pelagibacterales bacterium]